MREPSRSGRGRRGNAMLEFALSFGVLWMFFSGVFQFGYSIYVYNSLTTAVGNGARYAARVDFDDPAHTFVDQVRSMVVYGTPAGDGKAMVPGLTPGHVSVTWTADAKGVPQTITVGVVNYTLDTIFKTYRFHNKPRMTVRFLGSYKT
ncbi:MAG: pilus assembly protein [Bryobacterales bacterium]|nr:pilus assembly protein [Bryobacterales bacterium]